MPRLSLLQYHPLKKKAQNWGWLGSGDFIVSDGFRQSNIDNAAYSAGIKRGDIVSSTAAVAAVVAVTVVKVLPPTHTPDLVAGCVTRGTSNNNKRK